MVLKSKVLNLVCSLVLVWSIGVTETWAQNPTFEKDFEAIVKIRTNREHNVTPSREDEESFKEGLTYYRRSYFQLAHLNFSNAVKSGHVEAHLYLALMFLKGEGCDRSLQSSFRVISKAAELEDLDAIYLLGRMYEEDKFGEKDPAKAVSCFKKGSKHKHKWSLDKLGMYLLNGWGGVEKNPKEAFSCFMDAAQMGEPNSQYNLSVLLEKGQGCRQNSQEAFIWREEAASHGHFIAQAELGQIYSRQGNKELGFSWLKRAADGGHALSQYNVGIHLEKGIGCQKNLDQAFYYIEEAVLQNLAVAQFKKGMMLYHGLGCKRDLKEAYKYYLIAANKGVVEAQINFGLMLINGEGCTRDVALGMRWLKRAAESGNPHAQHAYGVEFLKVEDVENGLLWIEKAASQGHEKAREILEVLNQ